MEIIADPMQLRRRCDELRGDDGRVGFVPTMGFLHDGHLELIRTAKQHADHVVVSIFVNPKQFGAGEDLESYPRDLEADARKCEALGVAVLFTPTAEVVYPPGFQTHIDVEEVSQGLCGAGRPGHFRGVATVVAKLFNLVGPCVAAFGKKDYQQLQLIRRMVLDLALPVEILGVPIVREPDGLARSSRNAYLDQEQRQAATVLWRALQAAREALTQADSMPSAALCAVADKVLAEEPACTAEYVELRDLERFAPVDDARTGSVVMLIACRVGTTRLIDNLEL